MESLFVILVSRHGLPCHVSAIYSTPYARDIMAEEIRASRKRGSTTWRKCRTVTRTIPRDQYDATLAAEGFRIPA